MQVVAHFDVPSNLAPALLNGKLLRRGGVLQWAPGTARAGEVATWLREVSPSPTSPSQLVPSSPTLSSALSLAGSVASVLNLGATVAFGVATLRGLRRVDAKLDLLLEGQGQLFESHNQLQASVDLGFQMMAHGFEQLLEGERRLAAQIDARFHEQVLDKLRASARDMQTLANLEAGDTRRIARLEYALARTTDAFEPLHREATEAASAACQAFRASTGATRLRIDDTHLKAVCRIRMTASAAAQRARVLAETGQPRESASFLEGVAQRLHEQLLLLGTAMFEDGLVYDDLLNCHWPQRGISPTRVGQWAQRFDPQRGSLAAVLESLQERVVALTSLNDRKVDWKHAVRAPAFFEDLDGAWEDVERISGYALEYREMASRGVSLGAYASALRVADVPDGTKLVFLTQAHDQDRSSE